eukprot:757093-Hanusia_phi.AAC.1
MPALLSSFLLPADLVQAVADLTEAVRLDPSNTNALYNREDARAGGRRERGGEERRGEAERSGVEMRKIFDMSTRRQCVRLTGTVRSCYCRLHQ